MQPIGRPGNPPHRLEWLLSVCHSRSEWKRTAKETWASPLLVEQGQPWARLSARCGLPAVPRGHCLPRSSRPRGQAPRAWGGVQEAGGGWVGGESRLRAPLQCSRPSPQGSPPAGQILRPEGRTVNRPAPRPPRPTAWSEALQEDRLLRGPPDTAPSRGVRKPARGRPPGEHGFVRTEDAQGTAW